MDDFQSEDIDSLIGKEIQGKYRVLHSLPSQNLQIRRYCLQNLIMGTNAEMILLGQTDIDQKPWEDFLNNFITEAARLNTITNQYIAPIFSTGVLGNTAFLITSEANGQSLGQFLQNSSTLSQQQITTIIGQIGEALVEAHRHQIFHGNINPGQIEITQDENGEIICSLRELGLVHFLVRSRTNLTQLTRTGKTFANPQYMAPELFSGKKPNALSDIYSLGILSYQLCSGQPPFTDDGSIMDIMLKHFEQTPAPLDSTAKVETLSEFLSPWVAATMQKDPLERPADLEQHLAELYITVRGFHLLDDQDRLSPDDGGAFCELGTLHPRAKRRSSKIQTEQRQILSGFSFALIIALPVLLIIFSLVWLIKQRLPSEASLAARPTSGEFSLQAKSDSLADSLADTSTQTVPTTQALPTTTPSSAQELGATNSPTISSAEKSAGNLTLTAKTESTTPKKEDISFLGLTVSTISEASATELKLRDRRGLIVQAVNPQSPASRAGLAPGDIIQKSETKGENILSWRLLDVSSVADLNDAVIDAKARNNRLALSVKRGSYEGLLIFIPLTSDSQKISPTGGSS